jgi:hypothetical protein
MSFSLLLKRLLFCGSLLVATATSHSVCAQTTKAAAPQADLKDGAYRRNGIVMRLQAGQASRLSAPMKFDNGLTLRPDGIMVGKDGSRQLLEEGKALNMQGQIVNLRDDMKTAAAIERHDQQVTGAKPTVITRSVSTDIVSPEINAAVRRTEERMSTLQQMSTLLNERATTAAGASSQSQSIDTRIQEIDTKLKR